MTLTKKLFSFIVILFLFISKSSYSQKVNKQFNFENLTNINGGKIPSSELDGKYRIVHLWGTWCAPCIKEIPTLNDLKNSFNDRDDIVFLAVAYSKLDDNEKIKTFLKKKSFDFIHLSPSTDSNFFSFTGSVSFPTTVVYDKNGKLIFTHKSELNSKKIKKLKNLLNNQ